MKILNTEIRCDKTGYEREIIILIELEKGDAITPIVAYMELQDWFAGLNESSKSLLRKKGASSCGLLYHHPVTQKYSLSICIWNQDDAPVRVPFADVICYLADDVWKEARRIYEDRTV